MKEIKININNNDYFVKDNKTVLEVIRENNIDDIPTLCHSDKLIPYSSCFVCAVEIEGFNTLKPSCATPVADNMVIKTNTPMVMDARRTALELILSNHYADCIAPCTQECPAGVDIQGYIALASMGKYEEAIALIKETNPLPLVCGRVCTRPCELACRRNEADEGLAIDFLKRYCADVDMVSKYRKIPKKTKSHNKKVAIIGSGPAGLSAAYYLALNGIECEIFEKLSEPGGMLRWGIPAYRLPRDILTKEISFIEDLGVKIHINKEWGKDFTLRSLKNDFDAVFIGIGSHKSSSMRIKGEDNPSILEGITFLREFEKGNYDLNNKTIMIIGGGNTAIDCARTSLRLGSKKVILLYRRTRKEMPANDIEIEEAIKEGVEMHFLSAPVSAHTDEKGEFLGLDCIKMELGEPDSSGRRRPVPIEGSEHLIKCDIVISAIGQQTDTSFLKNVKEIDDEPIEEELNYSRWTTIEIDEVSYMSNIPGIFAGGDIVSGPWIAISAIDHGRKAANGIFRYLTGNKLFDTGKPFYSLRKNLSDDIYIPEVKEKTEKVKMPELSIKERENNFEEVELGLSEKDAENEAKRCLSCGCIAVFDCDLKDYATQYKIDLKNYKNKVEFRDQECKKIHPFINYELNKCILCGKCVRVCDEVRRVWAISFTKRGFNAEIQPVLDKPLLESACISCGECVDICPVGALTEIYPSNLPGPFTFQKTQSSCFLCGNLCQIEYLSKGGIPLSVKPRGDINSSSGLCMKGRFGLTRLHKDYINDDIRGIQEGQASAFTDLLTELKGKDIGLFISPYTSNEEAEILSDIADLLSISNRGILSSFVPGFVFEDLSPVYDTNKSDLIIAINPNRNEGNMNIDLFLNDLLKKNKDIQCIYGDHDEIWNSGLDSLHTGNDEKMNYLLFSILKEITDSSKLESCPLYSLIKDLDTLGPEIYPDIDQDIDLILKKIENNDSISIIPNSCSSRTIVLCDILYRLLKKQGKQAKFSMFTHGLNLRGLYDKGFDKEVSFDMEYGIFYGENPFLDENLKSKLKNLKGLTIIDEFEPENESHTFIKLPPFHFNEGTYTLFDGSSWEYKGMESKRPFYSRRDILSMILENIKASIDLKPDCDKSEMDKYKLREVYNTNTLNYKMNEFIKKYKLI